MTPRLARPREDLKREATRRLLLDRALELFQRRGVEATTMRDIAKAAKLSLGAAYYHFPSKDALVFAYYEANQVEMEAVARAASGDLRERLGLVFHRKLVSIRPYRRMLAAIVQRLIDPADPMSAFSSTSQSVRARAIAVLERVIGSDLPPQSAVLAAQTLWLVMLAMMLVCVNDDTRGQHRTHRLVDDALDLLAPLIPLLTTPVGRTLAERVTRALARAQIG
jgi:AcrR family transcriptional regulator